jgi:CheY-like chemotaxis protein
MLTVLIVDPDPARRKGIVGHFRQRFNVFAVADVESGLSQFRKKHPVCALVSFEQDRGNGPQLCASFRSQNATCATVVYGEPVGKSRASERLLTALDVFIPDDVEPAMLEALAWDTIARRYLKGGDIRPGENNAWASLVEEEPRLEQVRSVHALDPGAMRTEAASFLGKVKEVLLSDVTEVIPMLGDGEDALPHLLFLESDPASRKAIQEFYGPQSQLVFARHAADLLGLVERHAISAVVIRLDESEGLTRALVSDLRGAGSDAFPIVVHGAPIARMDGVDRAHPERLPLDLLDRLLQPELERYADRRAEVALAHHATSQTGEVIHAFRAVDDAAEAYSWPDLLKSDVSWYHLRLLLIKDLEKQPAEKRAEAPDERTWAELLQSAANVRNLKALLRRDLLGSLGES